MNAYQEYSNKNRSRSVAEDRSVGTTHRNLQEFIENSPRVKQLNAYQKMADAYSSMQQKPVQQKQNDDKLNDRLVERKEMPAAVFSAHTKTNEGSSETIHTTNSVVQKAKHTPKNKATGKKKTTPKKNKLKTKKMKKALPAKKQTMTVRNKTNAYTSGMINQISLPRGVEARPRAEAQKVANFLGGSWVGGHMVNDQLGGSGGFSNIVPITSSMNGQHKTIENRANNLLTNGHGNTVEYKMNINRRETRVHGLSTVKNLPVEFKQTLDVYPANAAPYTVNGNVLTHP